MVDVDQSPTARGYWAATPAAPAWLRIDRRRGWLVVEYYSVGRN